MSAVSESVTLPDPASTRKLLNIIAVVAIVDFILLVPLFLGLVGVIDTDSFVQPVGMIHGLIFIGLVLMTGKGALEKRWGWWFPIITIITGGAIGSLIGDWIIRRRAATPAA